MIDARPVRGTFRTLRSWANAILIAILFAIPWLRLDGEPLVLLDIPARKFHVFGLVIFPQELYFLWLILAGLALALFFFTALLGRLWCGWACPQTVFTDVFAGVARRIQRWKGVRPPRHVPLWRKVATHAVWLGLSWVIGLHLVGYFVSPYELFGDLFARGEVHWTTASFHGAMMGLAYLDFAIVRQTFCKYLCPYARFQGVLFDHDTLVVGYDARRGEPRGKKGTVSGDCVDCGLCVQVCPTGIDIREGLQLECIACTQCIDACNGVMEKVARPKNLIGYRSLVGLEGERPARLARPRVVAYGALLVGVTTAFVALLAVRPSMDLQVHHAASGALYSTTADGRVGNAFTLHIQNREREARSFRIALEDGAGYELVAGMNPVQVPAASAAETRVFVLAGKDAARSREIRFVLEPAGGAGGRVVRSARFVAPGGPRGS